MQIESTRQRIVREQQRLIVGTTRAKNTLLRAARDEARSWQSYVTEEQRRAREAVAASVALVRSKSGLERALLRAADRALTDAHASVKARLGRIDRELTADATPAVEVVSAPRRPRAKARVPARRAH